MSVNVAKEVAAMKRMTVKQLKSKYTEVFGDETRTGNKAWLAAHVADGLQKADGPELQRRLEVCSLCDQRNDDRSSVCGCFLAEKAAWRSSECPLGKWNQQPEVSNVE